MPAFEKSSITKISSVENFLNYLYPKKLIFKRFLIEKDREIVIVIERYNLINNNF